MYFYKIGIIHDAAVCFFTYDRMVCVWMGGCKIFPSVVLTHASIGWM